MVKEFEEVRNWGKIRGVGGKETFPDTERGQSQTQRMFQEAVEVHDALVKRDFHELQDALGDTIVTIINLANIYDLNAEDCLEQAFGVIKLRKGLTTDKGDFVRYKKLSQEDQLICDKKQGSPGEEYFKEELLDTLGPEDFRR